jgi:hypothetical protein
MLLMMDPLLRAARLYAEDCIIVRVNNSTRPFHAGQGPRVRLWVLGAVGTLITLSACTQREASPQAIPGTPPFVTSASIIDLMSGEVDPAADALWLSVATISTREGVVQRKPNTEAEWQEERRHAIALIEASNLLMMPGRVVAYPGQMLESPPGEGDYPPEQSLAAIRKEPAVFAAFARILQQSSLSALRAIEARDADKLLEAGGDIDAACEQCHRRFWYPTAAGAPPSP